MYRMVRYDFWLCRWETVCENVTWAEAQRIRAKDPTLATVKMTWKQA